MNRNQMGNMEDETPIVIVSNGCQKQGRGRFGLLLMTIFAVLLTPFLGWGQTSGDYSGIYYIGSVGYDADNPSNRSATKTTPTTAQSLSKATYMAAARKAPSTATRESSLHRYRSKTSQWLRLVLVFIENNPVFGFKK